MFPPPTIDSHHKSVSHHWFTSRECFPPSIHITSGIGEIQSGIVWWLLLVLKCIRWERQSSCRFQFGFRHLGVLSTYHRTPQTPVTYLLTCRVKAEGGKHSCNMGWTTRHILGTYNNNNQDFVSSKWGLDTKLPCHMWLNKWGKT